MAKEDENPNGGLSQKGREKFKRQDGSNLKPGVKNYSSASLADKKRWISWASRFAGISKVPPLTLSNGEPSRFALSFAAWGEPVPKTVADVRRTYAKAKARQKQISGAEKASDSDSDSSMSTQKAMQTKRLHDQLLERMPEGATHETCALCSATDTPEGGDHVTYTEDELQAAVAAATAELETRIEEMESAARASEVDAQVEAAKAEAQAEIAELRAQLDTAVLEVEAAKSEKDAVIAYLNEIAEAEKAEAEIAARREERIAKVKEVASFPDEYLEANANRFAAMSDEDFENRCAEWASLSSKAPAPVADDKIPTKTALTASREDHTPNDRGRSAVRELLGGILRGEDPRTL